MGVNDKRENTFRGQLCDAIKGRWGNSSYTQKHHGSEFSAGLPDMLTLVTGEVTFLELKAVDDTYFPTFNWAKQPTALQLKILMDIHYAGGNARVLLYVHPLKTVYVRSAKWVYMMRNDTFIGNSHHENAKWTQKDMELAPGAFDWKGVNTEQDTLRRMLFAPCLL